VKSVFPAVILKGHDPTGEGIRNYLLTGRFPVRCWNVMNIRFRNSLLALTLPTLINSLAFAKEISLVEFESRTAFLLLAETSRSKITEDSHQCAPRNLK